MKIAILLILIFLLASPALSLAALDNNATDDFCSLVEKQDFITIEKEINVYLDEATKNNLDALGSLQIWLKEKKCVKEVIVPEEIIKTKPARKDVRIIFICGGNIIEKTLCVILDSSMDASFH